MRKTCFRIAVDPDQGLTQKKLIASCEICDVERDRDGPIAGGRGRRHSGTGFWSNQGRAAENTNRERLVRDQAFMIFCGGMEHGSSISESLGLNEETLCF